MNHISDSADEQMDWAAVQAPLGRRFEHVQLLPLSGRIHDEAAYVRGLARLLAAWPASADNAGVSAVRTAGVATSASTPDPSTHLHVLSLVPNPPEPHQRFAATDAQRQQLLDALAQVENRTLAIGVRGGYGITRLLDRAPLAAIARRLGQTDSALCGHSDFTALHLALLAVCLREGLPVPALLQGPMLCIDWGAQQTVERTFADLMAVLREDGSTGGEDDGQPLPVTTAEQWADAGALEVLQADAATLSNDVTQTTLEGCLWGGNLSMICALIGTPHLPPVQGGLLFIEDVNEHPYRIERMLLQLHQAGILQQQRALIVGACSDWKPSPLDHGYGLQDALAFIAQTSGVPVLTGLRFGHIADKLTLPVGRTGRLVPVPDAQGAGRVQLWVQRV